MGPNANEIDINKNEIYMAKILHWGPKATYSPLIHVGGLRWANFMFRVGGNANFRVFRYQHVGIAHANLRVGPNASSFASQWNIGFRIKKTTQIGHWIDLLI